MCQGCCCFAGLVDGVWDCWVCGNDGWSAGEGGGGAAATYTVKKGDTLSEIAQNFEVSVSDIMAANPGKYANPDIIGIGDIITLPATAVLTSFAPAGAAVTSLATPSSSALSNFFGVGYGKDTWLFEGEFYETSSKLPGTDVLAGGEGGGTAIPAWRVAGSGTDALLTGVWHAAIAYLAGTMIGGMLGMSEENSKALGTSLAAGVGVYKGLSTWTTASSKFGTFLTGHPMMIGVGIGTVVFIAMYKKVETKIVTFECMPWQAPNGGNSCEVCNDDELACSEYRCSSLGQSCEIVNSGTVEERCVYVNPRDVTPPIINPNYEMLSRDYQYDNVRTSPPGPGFEIVNSASSDGCLKAFTSLEFGITTDEPAQCKIDFNYTENFDSMIAYVGGSNFYSYNHSEAFSLPGAEVLMGAGFTLENGKDMEFYLRCKDKNGNENSAAYAVEFCIDPTPDTTAPVIEATSILNGGCVAENTDSAEVVFFVNEPSECKWSFQDQHFDLMENSMSCSTSYDQVNAAQLFGCSADLTGIPRDGATYYVRCKDQPGIVEEDRNANTQSFEFDLRGSTGLVLKNLRPNETVFGGVSPAPIELYAETLFGCNEGLAICEWSNDGSNYIQFFDTNNEDGIHTQRLDLGEGVHNYYIRCIDAGGNVATDVVTFTVDIDTNAPVVARVYEEGGMLKIVTVRDSECSYSLDNCDFSFDQGVEMPYTDTTAHVVEWGEDNTYHIKCRDEFLNEGAGCSVIVRPTENFL